MAETNIYERLRKVQLELKVPKSQRNAFGNYNYRNAEDILEAVKPVLDKYGLLLIVHDEVVQIGDRYYVKATAAVTDGERSQSALAPLSATAFAREEETKKGMDGAQVTGSASSYARKYALNGLFAIDDTKDADSDEHASQTRSATQTASKPALGQTVAEATGSPKHITKGQATLLLAKYRTKTGITDKVELLDAFIAEFGWAINEVPSGEYEAVLAEVKDEEAA